MPANGEGCEVFDELDFDVMVDAIAEHELGDAEAILAGKKPKVPLRCVG